MKIAVASEGKTKDDEVSDVCARAPFFQIYEDGELVELIENPFRVGGGGAGASVARMLTDKGCELLICGRFGPNIIEWLERGNCRHMVFNGTVKESLENAETKE